MGAKRKHAAPARKKKGKTKHDVAHMGLDDLLAADVLDSDQSNGGNDRQDDRREDEPVSPASLDSEDISNSDDISDSEDSDSEGDLEFAEADIERLKEQDPDFYKHVALEHVPSQARMGCSLGIRLTA